MTMTLRRRVALKIGYDGTVFHGSAPQPGVRTVEGELRRIIGEGVPNQISDTLRLLAASRTDKGVSALGNVWALDIDGVYSHLPQIINSSSLPIWCFGVAEMPDKFHPRHAIRRWYRYLLSAPGLDSASLECYCGLFIGEHDFASFCKRDPSRAVDTVRVLDRIEVHGLGELVAVDFYAPSFLWKQVRRVTAALVALARGEVEPERVCRALSGETSEDFGLVAPEPLVLMDIEYEPAVVFEPVAGSLRHARERIGKLY